MKLRLLFLPPLVAVILPACQAQTKPSHSAQYVAMGSSFAAGPGVGSRTPASPTQCSRSADNYAHRFAQKRGLALADVTCSGATTESILKSWRSLPPQLDAVGPHTRLVTVTIGGNDVSYVGNLFGWSCENAPRRINAVWSRLVCKVIPEATVEEKFTGLEDRMRAIVDGVHQRSPHAKVIFVDYVTILPATGSCPDKLPLNGTELEEARSVSARLAELTEKVARETGSGLVKASELTRGHNVCSADPWVFGLQFPADPSVFGPVAYHPNAEAMHAIAARLDQIIPSL
ncbi:MAG: SGNH/GDSL hydrolase family protein [Acidobacteriaceae bacterium]